MGNGPVVTDLIRQAMQTQGISQRGLAARLALSDQYVSDFLRRRRPIGVEVALALEDALGLKAEELLCRQIAAKLEKVRSDVAAD
jgi:plasmid maintenance system antidote protein VapI